MKKLITLLIVMLFGLVIVGCGNNSTTVNTTSTTGTTATSATTGTTASTATTSTTGTTATTNPPVVTTVTFASWGIGTEAENNLLRRRIAEFNETHTEIQIQIVQHEGNWEQWLTTKAAAGEFPDIVSVGNVPGYVINNWIGDISDVVDEEWNDIPEALTDSVTYGDKIYGIPAAYHYFGYYANFDLLDTVSTATFDDFDFTAEEFFQAIMDLKDVNVTDGSGTIGILNANDIVNWYPSILDTTGTIQHFVWNGTEFDFNGDPMKQAIAKAADLQSGGYTFGFYSDQKPDENTPSQRETIFGANWDGAVFRAGQMGFFYDASWGATSYANDIGDTFNYDFVGLPNSRVIGVSDYYGISNTAENKAAAYEAAKYLTFGAEGINAAFDIIADAKTNEDKTFTMGGLPINETQSIIDEWFTTFPKPGFKTAYEKAAAGELTVLMEGNKYVPGFITARFSYNTGIDALISRPNNPAGSTLTIGDFIYDASLGRISYANYMTQQLEGAINYEFLKAQFELSQK